MVVKCISQKLNNEQVEFVADIFKSSDFHVTIGKEYLIYGMTFNPSEGNKICLVQHISDNGHLVSSPILLFEVVDNRASQFWKIRLLPSGDVTLWPESFYKEFFHDDLFEEVPEIVDNFMKVKSLMENEFE